MVVKLEKYGISMYSVAIAILLVGIGELSYTYIPEAALSGDNQRFL